VARYIQFTYQIKFFDKMAPLWGLRGRLPPNR
jgi:hypothetical protein